MAKFLVEILFSATGEPQVRGTYESIGSSAKSASDAVTAASLKSEASLRRVTEAAVKLQEQMQDTKKSSGLIADMTSLNTKLQEQITAIKGGTDTYTAWIQKQKDAALAQQILTAQVRAGVSANSDAGKSIAAQITQMSKLQSELGQLKQGVSGNDTVLGEFLGKLGQFAGPGGQAAVSTINQLTVAFSGMSEGEGTAAGGLAGLVDGLGPLLPALIGIAVAVAGVGVAWKTFGFFKDTIAEGMKTQVIIDQLEASLRANGSAAGYTSEEMIKLAGAMVNVSGRAKDDIIQGEQILTRYTRIGHDVFPRVVKAALDLAQATGKPLAESFIIAGKAAEGSTTGFRALTEAGIVLSSKQKQTMQDWLAAGEIGKYQAYILGLLEEKTRDLALANSLTLAGGIAIASQKMKLFREGIASEVIPALEVLFGGLVQSLGGWDAVDKRISNLGHTIGNFIREAILGLILQYHTMVSDQDAAFASLSEGFKGIVDGVFNFVAAIIRAQAALPAWMGGGKSADAEMVALRTWQAEFDKKAKAMVDADRNAAVEHAKAGLVVIKAIEDHKQALEGQDKLYQGHGRLEDEIANKVKNTASAWAAVTAALREYSNKVADINTKQSQQASAQEYLAEALDHGLLAYNEGVVAQQRSAAITSKLTEVYTAHRAEIDKLNAEYAKLTDSNVTQTAQTREMAAKIKTAIDEENKSYVEQAAQIGINAGKVFDLTEANKLRLKGEQDLKALRDQLDTATARLVDTTNRNSEASKALTLAQAREKDILALLSPETRKRLDDLRFLIQLNKDADVSQEALNAALERTAGVRASVADWQQERAAVEQYGSAVAGILKQYGLLSAASNQQRIDEEILAKKKAGLSDADAEALRAQLEGQQKIVDGLHRMQAEVEINERVYKEFADSLASNFANIFGNFLKGEQVSLDSFKSAVQDTFASILQKQTQEWLTKWFEAMAQWLLRWIATQEAAKLAQAGLGTSGTGPVSDPNQYASLLGGGGGASIWGSAGTAGVAGSGSGVAGLFSGTGAFGAAGSVVAWIGVLYIFAKLVNSLNAHIQATGESVINLDKSLGITAPKADSHIQALEANGKQIAEVIQQFFITFGGIFQSLDSTIGIKRRGQGSNTEWKVYADGIVTNFGKDAQAAFDFATIEAIKHSSSIGLDPLVQAAIKDYAGKSLDEFKNQIQFAERIATQNLPGISGQLASAASQYFADLYQAQVQFKGDLVALDAAVESITKKFADTVQALKNSALGIDTSTADFLAGIVGFQKGIVDKSVEIAAQIQSQIEDAERQIAQMGKGPRPGVVNGDNTSGDRASDQADWDARLAQLRKNIELYKTELANIPKALSDSEVNMAVFDALYKYLQGSQKYAAQAAEYAKLKVTIEFESIKLQLIALGKWEQFAGMWQDALNASTKAATEQAKARPRAGSGGVSPTDERITLRAQIATLLAESRGAVHTSFLDLSTQIAELTKNAKAAKLPAAELAQGIDLLTKKFQASLLTQAQGYVGTGTDFTNRLKGVVDFFHELEDLGRAKTGMPNWLEAILKQKALDRFGAELNASIDQFNGLVDPMVSINQQADSLRQNILAYGQAMGLTADQIKAMLDKVTSGVDFQRQGAINGIMDTLFGYLKDDQTFAQQATDLKKKEVDLQFRLIEAQLRALNAWDDETQKIFDASKKAAEDAAVGVAQAAAFNYAQAVAQDRANVNAAGDAAVQAWRQAVVQFTQQTRALTTNPALSGLTSGQQYAAAQQNLNDLIVRARTGDTSALSQIDQARQTDLALAHTQFGGGQGYLEEYQRVMAASADLLTTAQQTEAQVFADAMAAQTQTQTSALTTAIYDSANQVAAAIRAGFAGIPHYAEGGITLRPHLALVGERGPEAIVPLSRPVTYPSLGARILPFRQDASSGGGNLGYTGNHDVVAAVGRLADAQARMAADIRSIAESSAKTARSNDGMMRTERIRQTIARRG